MLAPSLDEPGFPKWDFSRGRLVDTKTGAPYQPAAQVTFKPDDRIRLIFTTITFPGIPQGTQWWVRHTLPDERTVEGQRFTGGPGGYEFAVSLWTITIQPKTFEVDTLAPGRYVSEVRSQSGTSEAKTIACVAWRIQ